MEAGDDGGPLAAAFLSADAGVLELGWAGVAGGVLGADAVFLEAVLAGDGSLEGGAVEEAHGGG